MFVFGSRNPEPGHITLSLISELPSKPLNSLGRLFARRWFVECFPWANGGRRMGPGRALLVQWIDDLWHDSRHAVRTFHKNAGFAAIAILMLALGIGGAT